MHDPISVSMQKELLDPAIKGTMNVLTAAKEAGVRRVVLTSSISAVTPSPNWPGDVAKTEECWTDVEYCKQKGVRKGFQFFNFSFSLILTDIYSACFVISDLSETYVGEQGRN